MESEESKNNALARIIEQHTRPEVIDLEREQAVVLQQGSVLWTVSLYQHEEALRRAVSECAESFEKDAGVELFFGSPE